MIGLDRLMEKKGVLAAGQFSEERLVIRSVGDLSEQQMTQVAQICTDLNVNMRQKAKSLGAKTGMPWGEMQGWALAAGDLALLVAGNTGVFVKVSEADFNELFMGLYFDLGDPTQQVAY